MRILFGYYCHDNRIGDVVPSVELRPSIMVIAAASYVSAGIFMSLLIALILNMLSLHTNDIVPLSRLGLQMMRRDLEV